MVCNKDKDKDKNMYSIHSIVGYICVQFTTTQTPDEYVTQYKNTQLIFIKHTLYIQLYLA